MQPERRLSHAAIFPLKMPGGGGDPPAQSAGIPAVVRALAVATPASRPCLRATHPGRRIRAQDQGVHDHGKRIIDA